MRSQTGESYFSEDFVYYGWPGCACKNVDGIIGGEFQEVRLLWKQWRLEENRKEDGKQWIPSGSLSVVGILSYFLFFF